MKKEAITRDDLLEALKIGGSKSNAAKTLGMSKKAYNDLWTELMDKDVEQEKYQVAVCGDTHWGSTYSDVDAFNAFIAECVDRKIPTLIHCGDIVEGLMPRTGAVHERFLHDIDAILDYTVERFNAFADNFDRIYIVQGNHDESLGKRCEGFDICYNISKQFKRVVYNRNLTHNVDVYQLKGGLKTIIHHGWGNCSANLTNRTRGITTRLLNAGTEFDVLVTGHCHSRSIDYYLGKNSYSIGCFQRLTPYLASKPLVPMLEGTVLTYTTYPDGKLDTIVPEILNYDR